MTRSPKSPRTQAQSAVQEAAREYTIDELAWTSGSTVRNVRAYQDRGLLPPPEKRGRKGIYTEAHRVRLRMINRMLERGYNLANIAELIAAREEGRGLSELLGLEGAVTRPFVEELPDYVTLPQLVKRFGEFDPDLVTQAVRLGIIVPEGKRYRVPSPRLLQAGAELAKTGIPPARLFDVIEGLRGNVERVAEMLVQLVAEYVFDRHGKDRLPPKEDVPELAAVIWRLRPLVDMAVQPEVARAMGRALEKILGDRLETIIAHLDDGRLSDEELTLHGR